MGKKYSISIDDVPSPLLDDAATAEAVATTPIINNAPAPILFWYRFYHGKTAAVAKFEGLDSSHCCVDVISPSFASSS
jgi:hypothetical protein